MRARRSAARRSSPGTFLRNGQLIHGAIERLGHLERRNAETKYTPIWVAGHILVNGPGRKPYHGAWPNSDDRAIGKLSRGLAAEDVCDHVEVMPMEIFDLAGCVVSAPEPIEPHQALMARLSDELQGHFSSVGVGVNGVEVLLNPGEQALAAQLLAEYGDAVRVSVCEDADGCVFTPL